MPVEAKSAPKDSTSEEESVKISVPSSKLVHMLRCSECGFETILRHKFDTHNPCASKRNTSYTLYTCSCCLTSSTSLSMMDEHVEIYHPSQKVGIKKTTESFVKPTEEKCENSPVHSDVNSSAVEKLTLNNVAQSITFKTCKPSPPIKHRSSPTGAGSAKSAGLGDGAKSQDSVGSACEKVDHPINHSISSTNSISTVGTTAVSSNQPVLENSCGYPPFLGMFNFFNTPFTSDLTRPAANKSFLVPEAFSAFPTMTEEVPKTQTTTDTLSTRGVTCPICNQSAFHGPEELAKHLALVHLLPFPAILSCLSTTMMMNKNRFEEEYLNSVKDCRQIIPSNTVTTDNSRPNQDWCTRMSQATASSGVPSNTSCNGSGLNTFDELNKGKNNLTGQVPKNPKETEPFRVSSLTCPQCGGYFQNVQQLQLHFTQAHAEEFGSLLSGMMTRGRMPMGPPLFPPFFQQPSVQGRTESLGQLDGSAGGLATLTTQTETRLNRSEPRDAQSLDSTFFSPTPFAAAAAASSPWLSMQFAAAAAALGLSLPQKDPSKYPADESNLLSPYNTEQRSQLDRKREGPYVAHAESKRQRLQSNCESDNAATTQGCLMNGGVGVTDAMTFPVHWNSGPLAPSVTDTSKIPPFRGPLASSQSRLLDFGNPALLRMEFNSACPPIGAQFPLSESLGMLPSLYASVQRSAGPSALKNQVDQGLLKGGWQGELASLMHSHRSPTNTNFPWTSPTMVTKLDSQVQETTGLNEPALSDQSSVPLTKCTPPINLSGTAKTETPCSHPNAYSDNHNSSTNGIVHNTLRKTRSDMKVIHRYLVQVKHDNRDIHQIPYYELDQYIQDFVLTAKKKDGHEYEPESLKAFVHSLERHLKHHDYPHSVLKGSAFTGTRAVLNQRLNELRALSRSGGSSIGGYNSPSFCGNRRVPEDENVDRHTSAGATKKGLGAKTFSPAGLVQTGLLGKDNPQAILNSLWLINRTQFNIGGTQRHRNLVWGQFQLVTDDMGVKAIKFTPLFESAEVRYCRGYGGTGKNCGNGTGQLPSLSSSKRQPLPFNAVELFEIYANLRPPEARGVSEPFYLCPEPMWEQCGSWFRTNAAGSQMLSRIPRLLGLKLPREPVPASYSNDTQENSITDDNASLRTGMEEKQMTPFLTSHPNSTLGKLLPEHQQHQEQQQQQLQTLQHMGSPSFTPACPTIPPNIFNFLPFMFPHSSSEVGQTPVPNPYLMHPNSYANFLSPGNSGPFAPNLMSNLPETRKGKELEFNFGKSEANNLSHSGSVEGEQSGKSEKSADEAGHSSPAQMKPFSVHSFGGSPTTDDTDERSPRSTELASSLQAINTSGSPPLLLREQTYEPSQKDETSPPHSAGSEKSSRPASRTSQDSSKRLKITSTDKSQYENGGKELMAAHNQRNGQLVLSPPSEHQGVSVWNSEALNLTRCKTESSSCA